MISVIYYAYAAPTSVDDIGDFFSHVLKGKPVPKPMLETIVKSFSKPGFPDFIASSSSRIASGLEVLLKERLTEEVKVYNAYKHTAPFIEDVVSQVISDGATTVVTLAINPIHSATGGGTVHAEVANLLEGTAIRHIQLKDWHLNADIVSIYADRVNRAVKWLPIEAQKNAHVLFTVHSQPTDEERNAPYVKQFSELGQTIAKQIGVENFHITYRSAKGKSTWLGPDVKDKIRELHENGATGIITAELLALTADVESYFEIGEECQELCQELGLPFAVSEFPSDSFDVVYALAKLVQSNL